MSYTVKTTYSLVCDHCGKTAERAASTVATSGWLAVDGSGNIAEGWQTYPALSCVCPDCAAGLQELSDAADTARQAVTAYVAHEDESSTADTTEGETAQ